MLMPERTALGSPVSGRWGIGLWHRVAATKRVVYRDTEADEGVIRDTLQFRRMLDALSCHRAMVTLPAPDGRHFGTAVLRTQAERSVLLDCQTDKLGLPEHPPSNLNVIASGERGLLFFTLHGLVQLPGTVLQAGWPDTLIQVQSRRHFRVGCRMDGLYLTRFGAPVRHLLRDISEEGVGLMLEPGDWPYGSAQQSALLHLGNLTLPVPALQWVHSGSGMGAAAGRSVGARLGGMEPEHVRQLRRWLAARQAASLAQQRDQA